MEAQLLPREKKGLLVVKMKLKAAVWERGRTELLLTVEKKRNEDANFREEEDRTCRC